MSEMTTMADVDAYLEHHGVKGMRWGRTKPKTATDSKFTGGKAARERANSKIKNKKAMTTSTKIFLARVGIIAAAGALTFGPALADLGFRALGSAALKASSARGAASAESTLMAIGSTAVTALTQGADGVWRL